MGTSYFRARGSPSAGEEEQWSKGGGQRKREANAEKKKKKKNQTNKITDGPEHTASENRHGYPKG